MTLSEIYIELNNGNIEVVVEEIKRLNKLYRTGDSEISDPEFDRLIETLKMVDPENEIFKSGVLETAEDINPERKDTLKFPMFSLDKYPTLEDIKKWLTNNHLPLSTILICTAKYDGISILKNELTQLAWSRGDGITGETMHEHYKKLNDKCSSIDLYTIGELLFPKAAFKSQIFYRDNGEPFKNARNMMGGLKNSDTPSDYLQLAKHVRYGFADEDYSLNKSEQLDFISKYLKVVPYRTFRADELNFDELNKLYAEWSIEFDIDGLVLDIDDKDIRRKLGRGTNNNVAYAKAYKNPDWAEKAKTTINEIIYEISKQGYLKPVALLTPVDLEGVTVSRVTLNNAKFVKDNDLGVGSEVIIIRSGMVIPKIIEVVKATGFKMPVLKDYQIFWNDNEVELCVNGTEEQQIKKNISFFEILSTDNVSEGIINQLYASGYKTIKDILNMTISDFEKLDKFGKRKAEIVYNSINKSTSNVNLAKLMHASGFFNNLGSKKIDLLMDFTEKPTVDEIIKVDGFSDISANAYLDGYDNFYEWLQTVPQITIESTKKEAPISDSLKDKSFCFTGIRRKDLEEVIISKSGKIASGVSKNLTYLVCKDRYAGTSKLVKAEELGVILLSVDDLEKMLK